MRKPYASPYHHIVSLGEFEKSSELVIAAIDCQIMNHNDTLGEFAGFSNVCCLTFSARGCRNPGRLTIRNGNVSTSDPNYLFGATLLFECNEGYELKGPDTITCLEFGWSSRRLPYCKGERFPKDRDKYLSVRIISIEYIVGFKM